MLGFTTALTNCTGLWLAAVGATIATALLADHRGLDIEFSFHPEAGFGQINFDTNERILTRPHSGSGATRGGTATKESIHDVAETKVSATELGVRISPKVIGLTLVGITQNLIGRGDRFKSLSSGWVWIYIRVIFPSQFPIRLFDLIKRGVPRDS